MRCLFIVCMVSIQLAAASYYNPAELSRIAAYYSMYDIDMPESLEMQLAAAMSGVNNGYHQSSRPNYNQPSQQQQYHQQKPTTRSQYNRQPVPRYTNNQQYRNTNNQQYPNTYNQQYRNTNQQYRGNQQYQNTNQQYRNTNQQYRNTNQQYRNNNQQYRNTNQQYQNNNQQYRNTNNQQYQNRQQYQKPNNQYPRSQKSSGDIHRRGDAAVNSYQGYTTESYIPTTTQAVLQFETSTVLPNIQVTTDTLPAARSVQAKQAPVQSANHQRPKTYQKPSAMSYQWPSNRRNYQNTYPQRTTAPYNHYQRSHNYQRTNQNYYSRPNNPRASATGGYQNNYQRTNQNNYQTQNYNRYPQNTNTGFPSTNFLPFMAGSDMFDIS